MKLKNIKPPFLSLDRWWRAETVENILEDNWDGWHSSRVATWNVKAQSGSGTFKSLPKDEKEEILKRLKLLHNAANDNEKQDNIAIEIMKMVTISLFKLQFNWRLYNWKYTEQYCLFFNFITDRFGCQKSCFVRNSKKDFFHSKKISAA